MTFQLLNLERLEMLVEGEGRESFVARTRSVWLFVSNLLLTPYSTATVCRLLYEYMTFYYYAVACVECCSLHY